MHCECVCVCVCQIASRGGSKQNKPNETKTKIKQQNGIIMADILKNKQRHKLYRDSDIILLTRPLFHTEFSLVWAALEAFCCYCFEWQQRGGERDGGRGGVVMVTEVFHAAVLVRSVPESRGTRRGALSVPLPRRPPVSPPSVCQNKTQTAAEEEELSLLGSGV